MSLFDLCRSVMRQTGWKEPSAIASSSDLTARQMFALANETLEELSVMAWPQLDKTYDINLVLDDDEYSLPDDFRVMIGNSAFQSSEYYSVRGSMSAAEWAQRKYGLMSSMSRLAFRMAYSDAGLPVIRFAPTPSQTGTVTIEYRTINFARNDVGAEQPLYVLDTDVSKVPERLVRLGVKHRFRRAKGLDFSAELAEYNNAVAGALSQYRAQADIPIGGRPLLYDPELTHGYVPDTGFGV